MSSRARKAEKRRKRFGARVFATGFAGPALLTNSLLELRPLARGETISHAWNGVGFHLNRALKRVTNEEAKTAVREKT